jgi:hypothetical protein
MYTLYYKIVEIDLDFKRFLSIEQLFIEISPKNIKNEIIALLKLIEEDKNSNVILDSRRLIYHQLF